MILYGTFWSAREDKLRLILFYHDPWLVFWIAESAVLGVYIRLKREEKRRSGRLELSTGCHARARSCDADVTTSFKFANSANFCHSGRYQAYSSPILS